MEGYDSLPKESLSPVYKKQTQSKENHLRDSLVSQGFNEIVSYAFISKEDHDLFGQKQKTLDVANPLSQNMSVMRTNLVSGLVNTFLYNLNHGQQNQRLFEIGNTFLTKKSNEVIEQKLVAGLISGRKQSDNWKEKYAEVTFYDLKGAVQDLLTDSNKISSLQNCDIDFLHPGMSSYIFCKKENVGFLGSIHPDILDKLGVKEDLFLFSIDIEKLSFDRLKSFKEFSKFPSSSRDLAFLINKEIDSFSVESVIKSSAGEYYKHLEIFDVYEGKGVDDLKKSIALSITWQSNTKTLLDSDIDKAVEKIVNSVKRELGGDLRV